MGRVWGPVHKKSLNVGLHSMPGQDVIAFARQYRAVSADLARARTYGVDRLTVEYLERIVAMGHSAMYHSAARKPWNLGRLFRQELPASVFEARWYVFASFVVFMVPAILGYAMLRQTPDLAEQTIPSVMIARAEAGVAASNRGIGYAESPEVFLPVVSSSIIANNVQVAFSAFALGITAGVGTLFILIFNGLSIGTIVGFFHNVGLAEWILTFVAGHGVIELFCIWVAGAAGLMMAGVIVAPGDYSRSRAFAVRGAASGFVLLASRLSVSCWRVSLRVSFPRAVRLRLGNSG